MARPTSYPKTDAERSVQEYRLILEEIADGHQGLRFERPYETAAGNWRCALVRRTEDGGRRVPVRGEGRTELAALQKAATNAEAQGLLGRDF
jgi:hypothetical protein